MHKCNSVAVSSFKISPMTKKTPLVICLEARITNVNALCHGNPITAELFWKT